MKNTIYFENGIKHELTTKEIDVLKKALTDVDVHEDQLETLRVLQGLFLEHLD